MIALATVRPGLVNGEQPERQRPRLPWHEKLDAAARLNIERRRYGSVRRFSEVHNTIGTTLRSLEKMDPNQLSVFRRELSSRLRTEGHWLIPSAQAFALVQLTVQRQLDIALHDEQLYGGWLLLRGMVAEMQTGEGKTLTAALPACTIALAGTPVHVITANDYLVARDAEHLEPVFKALGLTVGSALTSKSSAERREAYHCDITYVSNKQVIFDYLRDQQTRTGPANSLRTRLGSLVTGKEPQLLLRGLCYAIIDEADSVLIDDARTPLILSDQRTSTVPSTNGAVALGLARRLLDPQDFEINRSERSVVLTEQGEQRLQQMTQALNGSWSNSRYRTELVRQALCAIHLFERDHHYLVAGGKVVLIDESTGRAMPDRKLTRGVHQMVEIKEGCATTEDHETVSSISAQSFFRRYHHLAGLTGTAREVRGEFESVFGLSVVSVPLHRPDLRTVLPLELHGLMEEKLRVLIERVATAHDSGRPVLIGTGSVAESEQISTVLERSGLPNQVLNASQDGQEAEIVANAGTRGSIVVATNMAGRGTDIPLAPGIPDIGGLHVISTHLNDARRIDRQLSGRCARQGDPGSFETIISLEDRLFCEVYPDAVRTMLTGWASADAPGWRLAAPLVARWAQWRKERRHQQMRLAVLRKHEDLKDLLAFSGTGG